MDNLASWAALVALIIIFIPWFFNKAEKEKSQYNWENENIFIKRHKK